MLASFIYVGREALEMMFLLFMITATVSLDKKLITAGGIGLLSGLIGGALLGDFLEDYEVGMYAMLSGLMLYLFFTSNNLPAHIKGHVQAIANNTATFWAGIFTVWFIFFRESMEVFTFMFQSINDNIASWTGAGFSVIFVAMLYKVLRNYKDTRALFNITRYAFLAFAVWFGYEALEHAHIL
tara:strand:+ start:290 stop:838 length:549 start_codon:yes stop_codon:yes gene_type:complete